MIEPGTPIGFSIIRSVRRVLLSSPEEGTAHIVAPVSCTFLRLYFINKCIAQCPHSFACPMAGSNWCHFVQRVQRIPVQFNAKMNASINWEDEKFSYIAIQKGEKDDSFEEHDWNRIVRHPIKKGGHVIMTLCSPAGKMDRKTITRSMGSIPYKAARKASWGDTWSGSPQKPPSLSRKNIDRDNIDPEKKRLRNKRKKMKRKLKKLQQMNKQDTKDLPSGRTQEDGRMEGRR